MNCGSPAAAGVLARDAKSGALLHKFNTSLLLERVKLALHLRYKGRHIGDTRHEACDHSPS